MVLICQTKKQKIGSFTTALIKKKKKKKCASLLASLLLSIRCPEYLPNPKELDLYMSMAADDGWCRHFDKKNKLCTIYEDRPRFCRVETETFGDIYGVDPEDMDEFCSSCCSEHIGDVYGGKRQVLQ